MEDTRNVVPFSELTIKDIPLVGGKNASLGEMMRHLSPKGVNIPEGFAVTAAAYWEFIIRNKIREQIRQLLNGLDRKTFSNLHEVGHRIREIVLNSPIPKDLEEDIRKAYTGFCDAHQREVEVAVRSSATAEDLPSASFAGQHESFLNIKGEAGLLTAVRQCFASLFNDRAIKYREDKGFDHMKVGLSVGVQLMVRSDLACAGIGFTLEPESGFREVIHLSGSWGLGENIVKGEVNPDEFYVFKTTLKSGKKAILSKKLGTKAKTLVYNDLADHLPGTTTVNMETPAEKRKTFVLNEEEIYTLAQWALIIEDHYKVPMDFEWAKDGFTNELYIVQARPETIHSIRNPALFTEFKLKEKGKVLVTGSSIGNRIASGVARLIASPSELEKLKPGEILVAATTNPDWNPLFKRAGAIITDKGGRTSHASIVARELGITAIVGTENATRVIKDGQTVTVACQEGSTCYVYDGLLKWEQKEIDFQGIKMPRTKPMLILGDPEKAFHLSFYPNAGIGLMRLEFIISNSIRVHPMALVHFDQLKDPVVKREIESITQGYTDKKNYFVTQLASAVGTIAAAFYPKDVIVRMSDFKTNEYASLVGGKEFEEEEENPMIGFRGASRYYNERYKAGFQLECEAMKMIRQEMGLKNVKLMIPFCRTVEEGKKVVKLMKEFGLSRGKDGLEIYMMTEIPSNVLLADEFAKVFDGFSIGSNDLTQLTLGIDRDNDIVSDLFTEKNPAVTALISSVIRAAKRNGVKIGLCGQAPSDYPEFAQFLVKEGIDSISFTPDALMKGIGNIQKAEKLNTVKRKVWKRISKVK